MDFLVNQNWNPNNKPVLVANFPYSREGYVTVGPGCDVSVDADEITLINMIKPQLFVSNRETDAEYFCFEIGVPFEREPFSRLIEIITPE